MDRKLVVAIADLVAGSIANMNRREHRPVDSNGMSYAAGEDGKVTPADLLDQQQAAETFYREKIKIRSSVHRRRDHQCAGRVGGVPGQARRGYAAVP